MKLKLGDIVEVAFLDHCEGSEDGEAIEFKVFGVVQANSRVSVEIGSWVYDDCKRRGDRNEMRFTIVKKAITSIHLLTKS